MRNGTFNVSGENGVNLIYDDSKRKIENKNGVSWVVTQSITENIEEFLEFISPVTFNNDSGNNYALLLEGNKGF